MKLADRPEPQPAINDVVVRVHASGFVPTELTWPSTWTDHVDRERTPSIPGHELAGVVTGLGYGTTGLSMGQLVFGLTDWYRDGALAEYVAVCNASGFALEVLSDFPQQWRERVARSFLSRRFLAGNCIWTKWSGPHPSDP